MLPNIELDKRQIAMNAANAIAEACISYDMQPLDLLIMLHWLVEQQYQLMRQTTFN